METPEAAPEAPPVVEAPALPVPVEPKVPLKPVPILINVYPISDPVVPRVQWGAKKAKKLAEPRKDPVSSLVVTHTVTETCDTEPLCVKVIQDLQDYHINSKGEDDIPFNFLVGGDGKVYEGLGWEAKSPFPKFLPSRYNDGNVLSVAFVGDYHIPEIKPWTPDDPKPVPIVDIKKPTEQMVRARRALVRYGEENKLLPRKRPIMTAILGKI